MRVYRIFQPHGLVQFLLPGDGNDPELVTLDRVATLSTIAPGAALPESLPVRLVVTDDLRRVLEPTDFPWIAGNLPAYTVEAFEALSPMLLRHGRPINLISDDDRIFVGLHVDRVVDALDQSRSELRRFSSGRLMDVERHVFVAERIGDSAMFRLPEFDRAGWTYVTDEYVLAVESSGFSGGSFDPVWDDDQRLA